MTAINNFSCRRMWRIARFNAPAICRQAAIYIGVSLAIGLFTAVSCQNSSIIIVTPFILMALLLMLWFGPMIHTSDAGVAIKTMLPATAMEKALFPMLHTFIIIPLSVLLPFALVMAASYGHVMKNIDMPSFINMVKLCTLSNPFQTFAATAVVMATCLWSATRFSRKRALRAVLLTFAAIFLNGLSAIIKIGIAMNALYGQGIIGHRPISANDNQELFNIISSLVSRANSSIEALTLYRIGENSVLALLLAALIWGIYRNIKNRQI